MSKTSEALREEIAEIIRESDCGALTLRYYGDADEIINKILDAAVENIDKAGLPVGEKIYAKAAINKLRGEK